MHINWCNCTYDEYIMTIREKWDFIKIVNTKYYENFIEVVINYPDIYEANIKIFETKEVEYSFLFYFYKVEMNKECFLNLFRPYFPDIAFFSEKNYITGVYKAALSDNSQTAADEIINTLYKFGKLSLKYLY